VNAPAVVASLSGVSVSPASVTGGTSATGTVTLSSAAPSGGASVTLSSSGASASVPASVTVAAGATSATFAVTTTSVASNTTVTLTATYSGVSRTASLTVNAPAALDCTTCHGSSGPTSGQHQFHISRGYDCSTCHGTGYSFTSRTVNTATHRNGTVDLTVSNWNATNRTCGGCHAAGTRNW
jgi:DnaJ-class molecular chaperone